MAVICWTGDNYFTKMCNMRKFAVVLAVFIGVLGFSLGETMKNCDLVKTDFERIVKLPHLRFLEKPETGKKVVFKKNIRFVYFCFE